MKRIGIAVAMVFLALGWTLAQDHPEKQKTHPGFDALKSLAGEWSGVAAHGGDPAPMVVTYKVTSGGHVVMETVFAGDPHEMVTMYYLDGDDLVLTHYCAMGNNPHMKAAPVTVEAGKPTVLSFTCTCEGKALEGQKHMHLGELTVTDGKAIDSKWTMYEAKQKVGQAAFKLTRKGG